MVYICTNFLENILDSIEVIERTQFSYEKFQRGGGGGGGGGGEFLKIYKWIYGSYSLHIF